MTNRRDMILGSLGAGGLFLLRDTQSKERPVKAPKPLNILILGGTGFIGPHHIHAALARGHHVAVFSRGKKHADLPENVEQLIGDRNSDLESIKGRDWDAVIDLATYGPIWVRTLGEALQGRVKHYTFVSTNAVYDNPAANPITTEDSKVKEYKGSEDPYTLTSPGAGADWIQQYGSLKVLCEREAEKQFPGRTLIVRPGFIFGPGGFSLCPFWMARLELGGEMLVAGAPSTPAQFVDIRDIAEWVIRMIERDGAGIYNMIGPASPLTLGRMIEAAGSVVSKSPKLTWVSPEWLAARKDKPTWANVLNWTESQGLAGLMRMSPARALAHGFTVRPIKTTFADSFAWHQSLPQTEQVQVFLGAKADDEGPMTWPIYLEREKDALAAWRSKKS